MDEIDATIKERNEQYADAWALTGVVCSNVRIAPNLLHLLAHNPQMFLPWVTIMCKLLRILGSPRNPDHWLDIAGYAMLVHNDLTGKRDSK
jgi:hypothetical protein